MVTADALVEDVHFRWRTTDAALARAQGAGGEPLRRGRDGRAPARLPADARPARANVERQRGSTASSPGCSRWRARVAARSSAATSRARASSAPAITALGAVPRGRALLRSGARPGDRMFVTGAARRRGGGPAPARAARRGRARPSRALVRRQLAPRRRSWAGPRARAAGLSHAARSTSPTDSRRTSATSRARAASARASSSSACRSRAGSRRGARSASTDELALAGGEDYELLFAAPAARAERGRDRQATRRAA